MKSHIISHVYFEDQCFAVSTRLLISAYRLPYAETSVHELLGLSSKLIDQISCAVGSLYSHNKICESLLNTGRLPQGDE